jgi:acetoacetyl-CoA synthetase
MKTPLWIPSEDKIKNANLTRFLEYVNKKDGKHLRTYPELYRWSVEAVPEFWARLWEFADIKASRGYDQVVDDVRKMPGAKWFSGARLNFAENLLRHRDDRPAFIFRGETQKKAQMTYAELYAAVARLAHSLRGLGLKPGDRVAGYMPNMMETAIAMLAATSVGAVWSSCATDIGSQAALDRLGQIEPKVLFTVNGYYYKGKPFSSLGNAAEIAKGIPSLKKVIVASYVDLPPDLTGIANSVRWEDFVSKEKTPPLEFEQLP